MQRRAVAHHQGHAALAAGCQKSAEPRRLYRLTRRRDYRCIILACDSGGSTKLCPVGRQQIGPGIAPEIMARTFEPLFSTRRYGTGLGLSTTRQIVEQHGGRIELTSRLGIGTRARILLPLAYSTSSSGNARMPDAA
jgi:signal transduction histidine kinase